MPMSDSDSPLKHRFSVPCGQKPAQQTRRSDVSAISMFARWYLKAILNPRLKEVPWQRYHALRGLGAAALHRSGRTGLLEST
jgi:hypothetical protein